MKMSAVKEPSMSKEARSAVVCAWARGEMSLDEHRQSLVQHCRRRRLRSDENGDQGEESLRSMRSTRRSILLLHAHALGSPSPAFALACPPLSRYRRSSTFFIRVSSYIYSQPLIRNASSQNTWRRVNYAQVIIAGHTLSVELFGLLGWHLFPTQGS